MIVLCVLEDLQSHALDDKLHREVLSVSCNAAPESRASSVVLAEFVDQVPQDCDSVSIHFPLFPQMHGTLTLVEHGRPDGSDGVNRSHSVGIRVFVGVGGKASRVRVCADAGRRVVDPSTHGVALGASVARLQADGSGHEVTPALTHAAGLEGVQAVAVGRATGKTGGETVVVSICALHDR